MMQGLLLRAQKGWIAQAKQFSGGGRPFKPATSLMVRDGKNTN